MTDKKREEILTKHIIWAWAFENTICVALWIVLAIFFDHWWIALFSGLFLSEFSNEKEEDKNAKV